MTADTTIPWQTTYSAAVAAAVEALPEPQKTTVQRHWARMEGDPYAPPSRPVSADGDDRRVIDLAPGLAVEYVPVPGLRTVDVVAVNWKPVQTSPNME